MVAPTPTGTVEPAQNNGGRARSRVSAEPAPERGRRPEPAPDPARAPERAKTVVAEARASQLAWPLPLDDVADARQIAVLTLANADPGALQWLQAEIGEPPDPERIREADRALA